MIKIALVDMSEQIGLIVLLAVSLVFILHGVVLQPWIEVLTACALVRLLVWKWGDAIQKKWDGFVFQVKLARSMAMMAGAVAGEQVLIEKGWKGRKKGDDPWKTMNEDWAKSASMFDNKVVDESVVKKESEVSKP